MSLQIWLPLNGDAHNQGVLNISPTVSGGTWDNGKMGKCYNGGGTGYIQANISITLNTSFTFSTWFKVNSFNTAWAKLFGFYKNGNEYCGLCYSSTDTIGFHIYDDVSGTRTKVFDNYFITSSYATIGVWVHTAIVYDGTYVKQYINGELINTGTIVSGMQVNDTYTTLGLCTSINGTSKPDCCLNDFRFYNHALTGKEIKEISRGLVLHYPLNRRAFGQDNLIHESANMSTSIWRYGASAALDANEGSGVIKLTGTSANWNASMGTPYNSSNTVNFIPYSTVQNKQVTFSLWIKSNESFDQGITFSLRTSSSSSRTKYFTAGYVAVTTQWQRKSITFTITDASFTGGSGTVSSSDYFFIEVYNHVDNRNVWVKGFKLEFGDKMTPWCPNYSDALYSSLQLDGTTEYDVSGFGNNGTKTGTFTYTSDTPKYMVSTQFSSGSKIISQDGMITTANPIFTCCFWTNMPTGTYSQWSDLVTFTGNAQFRMETSNTTGTNLTWYNYPIGTSNGIGTNSSISNDQWNHFTITCDGVNWKTYKNGVLANTVALSGTAWTPDGSVSLGDNGMLMKMSDFRIYTTALSADDILELYNSRR